MLPFQGYKTHPYDTVTLVQYRWYCTERTVQVVPGGAMHAITRCRQIFLVFREEGIDQFALIGQS